MVKLRLRFVRIVCITAALGILAGASAFAAAKKGDGSEVVVRRVDSNNLIRLRVYIDGKNAGSLKVGETSIYKVKNGDHTIYVGFEDYQQRTTEVSQFTSYNERFIFSITDTSIVLVRQEPVLTVPVTSGIAPVAEPVAPEHNLSDAEIAAYEGAVREAFNIATDKVQKKAKVAIINVDADNPTEGDFVLEELTFMAVHDKKGFTVIDRRKVEAYRAANHQPLTRYENDYLISLGELLGAQYVITGRLNGDGLFRRLRIRVLDVKTGVLVGDSSSRL